MKPEVYERLAASGRFHNTGKVLIGVQYVPRNNRIMSQDEERLQAALLGYRAPLFGPGTVPYLLYLLACGCFIAAIMKACS